MKKGFLSVFVALMLAVSFQRCNQDDVTSEVEKIQFAISVSSMDGNSGRIKVSLPPDVSVMLTIESHSGDPVLTRHQVRIFSFGESYITEPVELVPGNYKITDFLIVDSSSEIKFAAPKKGSPLAEAVANPLPRSLHVSKNMVSNLDVQVLDVSQHTPEEFGYVSFHVEAGSSFRIAVFANDDGKFELTDAVGYIVSGTDTLHHYKIKARVNNVLFAGDPQADYQLVVVKPGFETYMRAFKFSELEPTPLKVYLIKSEPQTKAFRLWYNPRTIPEEPQFARFSMLLGAEEAANITVDFGNGTVNDYSIPAGGKIEAALVVETGDYVIQVTGEIDKITSVMPYWEAVVEKADFSDLINLKKIEDGPLGTIEIRTVDLKNNHKLEAASVGGFLVDTLFLPADHALWNFSIYRSPKLSGEEIDVIIANIYSNTVNHNITNGWFDNRSGSGEMQGPLTAESLNKLRALRDTYGWTILPNP